VAIWQHCKIFRGIEDYCVLGCNAVVRRQPDVSEEHIASIFRVKEWAKKDQQKQGESQPRIDDILKCVDFKN
jgi:hypothetical protein